MLRRVSLEPLPFAVIPPGVVASVETPPPSPEHGGYEQRHLISRRLWLKAFDVSGHER